ncbi:unnamed protein product [Clonostachys rosea]|uniref:RING-type domain-containing protein n=1 Tax=Bionectria ochroleuca TaxID=29856 RepID=A0ABY6UH37_BIOOC|nr:unnamed protein product [Clonostachys rosea]
MAIVAYLVMLLLIPSGLALDSSIVYPQHHGEGLLGYLATTLQHAQIFDGASLQLTIAPIPRTGNLDNDTEVSIEGEGVLVEVSKIHQFVGPGSIAYLSCDVKFTNSSSTSSSLLLNQLLHAGASAVVLYTTSGDWCFLEEVFADSRIFTTVNASDAQNAVSYLKKAAKLPTKAKASIISDATSLGQYDGGETERIRRNPTVLIVICSVGGSVFALFAATVVVGVYRGLRYPERYGPRDGDDGSPSQTRIRGLTRAVLETFPVVKFAHRENSKPSDTDVELRVGEEQKDAGNDGTAEPTGGEYSTCSICTEDFGMQEDVRILPCNHQFHPRCVDPWLIQHSSSCPLWYVTSHRLMRVNKLDH